LPMAWRDPAGGRGIAILLPDSERLVAVSAA